MELVQIINPIMASAYNLCKTKPLKCMPGQDDVWYNFGTNILH